MNDISASLLSDSNLEGYAPLLALPEERLRDLTRELLRDLSSDTTTFFGRHGLTQSELLDRLDSIVATQDVDDPSRAWLLVILAFGKSIALSVRLGTEGISPQAVDLIGLRRILALDVRVPDCLSQIYGLPQSVAGAEVDWRTATLHRLGTTSVIFKARTRGLEQHELAVKLSHILFMSVGPVSSATTDYFDDWGHLSQQCSAVATVWASGEGWVIENFVNGFTIAEARAVLEAEGASPLDIVRRLFLPVLQSVKELHSVSPDRGHGDLTPSNVIVSDLRLDVPRAVFIDMGRNLLASEVIGRVTSAERFYVAPEVRRMSPEVRSTAPSADIYSLGPLLGFCLGYGAGEGLFGLDERLFAEHPEFARVAATCSVIQPNRRGWWLLSRKGAESEELETPFILDAVRDRVAYLVSTLRDLGPAVLAAPAGWRLYVESLVGSWSKVAAACQRLWRLASSSRKKSTGLSSVGSWRIFASGAAFAIGAVVLFYSWALDYGWDPISIGYVWRKTAFDDGTIANHWQIRFVGLSFLVACFQYNVCAFGWVHYMRSNVPRRLVLAGEGLLWVLTFIVDICIGVSLFLWPKGWLICSALGVLAVAANNVVAMRVRQAVAKSPDLESLQRELDDHDREDILSYWAPTAVTFSAVMLAVSGLGIAGSVHDWGIWALAITAINVVVFSYSQATRQGFKVRRDMSRAVIAGELASREVLTRDREGSRRSLTP